MEINYLIVTIINFFSRSRKNIQSVQRNTFRPCSPLTEQENHQNPYKQTVVPRTYGYTSAQIQPQTDRRPLQINGS
jgi:hypothetical protein